MLYLLFHPYSFKFPPVRTRAEFFSLTRTGMSADSVGKNVSVNNVYQDCTVSVKKGVFGRKIANICLVIKVAMPSHKIPVS